MKITLHAKKHSQGYTGYIRVYRGLMAYNVSTEIVRPCKTDALHDAGWLLDNFNDMPCHTGKSTGFHSHA